MLAPSRYILLFFHFFRTENKKTKEENQLTAVLFFLPSAPSKRSPSVKEVNTGGGKIEIPRRDHSANCFLFS